jgi:ATP-dependent RNA helicase RhlE
MPESPLDPIAAGLYLSRRMGFDTLGLSAAVLEAVEESGYTTPTPIQAQAIPIILEGRDVIGASQTGTGKTAAFALPTLSKLTKMGKPQILVLEPTRELAHQVAEQFEKYGKHTGMKVALLYGGVGLGKQSEDLQAGADIVVATPGRLVDHFYRTTMRFGEIKVLILDEVDRMLDMGFLPQVRKIVNLCPWEGRQTLFFSATMPPAIQTFAQWCLTNPIEVEIARRAVASTVTHAFYPVAMDQRDELLLALLKETDYHSVMIFTRTRKEADEVTALIKTTGQSKVAAMHSDINQVDRMKALAGFKAGDYEILVATDVAARGIDISGVSHVINYRVPENAEDYVHRIGRTGRAEAEGDAFTILTADELDFAKSVEVFIDQKIPRRKLENFEYIYTALLDDSPPKPVRRKTGGGPKKKRR